MNGATPSQQVGDATYSVSPFWLRPASYWQPAHIVTSAWLGHAPFAFWLVDVLRPRRILELGTHFGFSFFAFAEAVRRFDLDSEVLAIDTWAGDDQSGFYGEDVYESVRSVAEAEYGGVTRLLRGYFADLRPSFDDNAVDLLHIDGRHGYEQVKEDFHQWLSAVRSGGVVLFHDTVERERGFGVWQLWAELASMYPSFEFTHSHGLGVIGIGDVSVPELRQLFDADRETCAQIRTDHEALGAVIERQAAFEAMPAEIDSLHEVVAVLSARIDNLEETIRERDAEIADYRNSTSWRITGPLRGLGRVVHRFGR